LKSQPCAKGEGLERQSRKKEQRKGGGACLIVSIKTIIAINIRK
jgi:hypothetical protein